MLLFVLCLGVVALFFLSPTKKQEKPSYHLNTENFENESIDELYSLVKGPYVAKNKGKGSSHKESSFSDLDLRNVTVVDFSRESFENVASPKCDRKGNTSWEKEYANMVDGDSIKATSEAI